MVNDHSLDGVFTAFVSAPDYTLVAEISFPARRGKWILRNVSDNLPSGKETVLAVSKSVFSVSKQSIAIGKKTPAGSGTRRVGEEKGGLGEAEGAVLRDFEGFADGVVKLDGVWPDGVCGVLDGGAAGVEKVDCVVELLGNCCVMEEEIRRGETQLQ